MRLFRAVILAGAVIAAAPHASAQSRADFIYLQDRVQRLEAQLANGGGGGTGSPQTDAQLSLRIGQLEDQVRSLTGQVQEATHMVQQLEDKLKRFQEDTEFRFRDLEGGGIKPIPDRTPLTQSPSIDAPQTATNPPPDDGTQGLASGPQVLGQLTLDGQAQQVAPGTPDTAANGDASDNADLEGRPLDLSALAEGLSASDNMFNGGPQTGQELALAVPADPRADFELGYSLIIAKDYAGAEAIFHEFIDAYPDNPLVPDARYWIGESRFQRGSFREAADTYLDIYTKYPQSPQAAPSLLRLAQSLERLGERDAACTTIGELRSKFGESVPTVAERANQDAQKWGC
ncbi:MAG: tol-pal system protein YbgF [Rhodobiaceae bacterium]|nr:tol-pal system protein YbgF [Rhodobiaceae bacterium]